MSDVVYLPTNRNNDARLLKRAIAVALQRYPDREVARRWGEMALATIDRFPSPPKPARKSLDIKVEGASEDEQQALASRVEEFLESYLRDVRDQQIQMHNEMWRLQRRVAELESEEVSELKL